MAKEGRFREDLYYRIHVVPIFIPPLRERVDDIPLLIDYFVNVYCAANRTPTKRIADDTMNALKRYAWPGNVRELQNVVQRLVLMTDAEIVTLKDVPSDIAQAAGKNSRGRFRLPSGGIKLNQELDAFEQNARRLAGGVSPIVVLQHYMERELAELLSNPRAVAALKARLEQLQKLNGTSEK